MFFDFKSVWKGRVYGVTNNIVTRGKEDLLLDGGMENRIIAFQRFRFPNFGGIGELGVKNFGGIGGLKYKLL